MPNNIQQLLTLALDAAFRGAHEIMEVWSAALDRVDSENKEDGSPVTEADLRANSAITHILKDSGLPVLSEESALIPYGERKDWETFWMIDPLDGTKEFINRNGDFTVNIALINNGKPVMGVVLTPAKGDVYYGTIPGGSYMSWVEDIQWDTARAEDILRSAERIPRAGGRDRYTIVASRSHRDELTDRYIALYRDKYGECDIFSRGSSLKICMVADGSADVYPRFGPTMEWDTAAADAVLRAAGGRMVSAKDRSDLRYNKPDLHNPGFIAAAGEIL